MVDFSRGQKDKLANIGALGAFPVRLVLDPGGMTLDVACFGLDEAQKLSDERYMVFYNQLATPNGEVRLALGGGEAVFAVEPQRLPPSVTRLVFAASVDGAGTMRQLGACAVNVGDAAFQFSGADFAAERAVIICEIYLRDGAWRFGAVGQGFSGGLSALLTHFGGTPAEEAAPQPLAATPKVSLSKVTLTKAGQKHAVSLVKGAGAPAKLVIQATWQDNGDDSSDNDDLDLRVGILLPDGRMKLVSAPDYPGKFDADPFVRHTGDVQVASIAAPATETVEVNPDIARRLGGRVALVFSVYSAVGNGAVSVASLKPVMRMIYGDQVVECAYDFSASKAAKDSSVYTYVIGTAIIDSDKVTLAPSGQTSKPGSEATPWLKWDGETVEVAIKGPAVFKGQPMVRKGPLQYC